MNEFEFWQTVFSGLGFFIALITMFLVLYIGRTQNVIAQQALRVSDFAEVFLMPQVIISKDQAGRDKVIGGQILIKNVSAYPVYLNAYTLNGIKHDVGNSAIPNNPDSWFGVPISQDILNAKEFSISVDFEDYQGKKYRTEGFGLFDGNGWAIKSKKRISVH